MDDTLEHAWRERRAPFNGETLFLSAALPLDDLIALLTRIVTSLQRRYPNAHLRKLNDWHEHDGVVLESSNIKWDELVRLLGSTESFSVAVSDDDYVRFGIYDSDGHFYLRFGFAGMLNGRESVPISGIFDLSAPADVCESIKPLVSPAEATVVPAKAFFDGRYAGDKRA